MPVKAGPAGAASWSAVNQLLDILERGHPGIRAETFARAQAACRHDGEDNTGAVLALLKNSAARKSPAG